MGSNLYAQQVYDYVANSQFLRKGVLPRPNWYYGNDVNTGIKHGNRFFESDGKNIFYIMNSVGDATFESYTQKATILEPTDKDTFNSQLIFVRYNILDSFFTTKTFGSNYLNSVLMVRMDEQNKSIAAIISTCGDSVRLNPNNSSQVLKFPNRLQRNWLIVLDLKGNLLSSFCLAESNYSLSPLSNEHLLNLEIGRFDFNKSIIVSIKPDKSVVSILPSLVSKSYQLKTGSNYIFSLNQQKSMLNWLRRTNTSDDYFNFKVSGIKMLAPFVLFKDYNKSLQHDTSFYAFDENEKLIMSIEHFKLDPTRRGANNYVYQIDSFGNFIPFLEYQTNNTNSITSIIENRKDLLLSIQSTDSILIYGKSFLGNLSSISSNGYIRGSLLKLIFNISKYEVENLLPFRGDSVLIKKVFKAKNGFYSMFAYEPNAAKFNILQNDTFLYKPDDGFIKTQKLWSTFRTLCYYDSAFNLKWCRKTIGINNIVDNGENLIIDYSTGYLITDYNFRYEVVGSVIPDPMLMVACVYNCKPLAFFDTLLSGNTMKFVNHSEYNSNYQWSFGDGITSVQRNPSHVFGKREEPYKMQLIVSNSCGADTFTRYYYTIPAAVKNSAKKGLKIYPNPITENKLYIEKPIQTDFESIQLFNTLGQELPIEVKAVNNSELQIQILSTVGSGVYYLKASTKDNRVYLNKLFVK